MTVNIKIASELKRVAPNLALGVLTGSVEVRDSDPTLWAQVDARANELRAAITLDQVYQLPQIEALRQTYRTIGKDPARFRGSQEALMRRVLRGQALYRINTIVDINNLISLTSLHAVGSYDTAKLRGSIVFRIGRDGEGYKGIGKDAVNIARLPVLADDVGAFGSPTSDSERAMILPSTHDITMIIVAFSGLDGLQRDLASAVTLVKTYAKNDVEDLETFIVE